jgi:putative endonuclease
MNDRQKLGKKGEDLAVDFLRKKKYEILDRNWRYSRSELDIIAKFDSKLVFVEVKAKRSDAYLPPEMNVGPQKRRTIIDAANRYMEAFNYEGEIRFDIISVLIHGKAGHTVTHFEDAFFPGMEG